MKGVGLVCLVDLIISFFFVKRTEDDGLDTFGLF